MVWVWIPTQTQKPKKKKLKRNCLPRIDFFFDGSSAKKNDAYQTMYTQTKHVHHCILNLHTPGLHTFHRKKQSQHGIIPCDLWHNLGNTISITKVYYWDAKKSDSITKSTSNSMLKKISGQSNEKNFI